MITDKGFSLMASEADGVVWRKSSYSGSSEGQCVEVAETPAHIHIRDSKTPEATPLTFTLTHFATFLKHASRTGA
ncbi:DUF397 domain-containing protein [Streptomyces sp. NPDC093252]|uniref:DUF397 domain-containing protein n=1 Tax=Streptomyces sp. NPDC093252 TaxID=3154980 RepID=UPI00342A1F32